MADARKPRRRSRRSLDAVADGAPDGTPLGDFVSEMRSMGAGEGVEPNQSLTEFVSAPSREPDLVVVSTTAPKARTPMIAQLSALAATTLGKVALTGGVAAAALGGVVAVNEIQEPDPVDIVATADDSSNSTIPELTPSPDADASAPVGSSTHSVLDAGSVTVVVDGLSVSVVSADPSPGWSAEIETDEPGEAQVNFRNGDARVDFRAEIEDGRLRIRVRDRRTDTETESFPDSDDSSVTRGRDADDVDDDDDDDDDPSGPDSGSDSDDDDDDDDDEDRSGSNSGSDSDDDDDDDEDRSGSNSGSDSDDDDDDDEDRSGSNSGSDSDDDDDRSGSNSGNG